MQISNNLNRCYLSLKSLARPVHHMAFYTHLKTHRVKCLLGFRPRSPTSLRSARARVDQLHPRRVRFRLRLQLRRVCRRLRHDSFPAFLYPPHIRAGCTRPAAASSRRGRATTMFLLSLGIQNGHGQLAALHETRVAHCPDIEGPGRVSSSCGRGAARPARSSRGSVL